jgi:hypothetical protein
MINVIQRNSAPSDQPDGITKTHRSTNPPQKSDPSVPDARRFEDRISAVVVPSLPPPTAIARMAHQTLVPLRRLLVFLAISFCFSVYTVIGQSTAGNGDIGSVLVVGKFRTQEQLNGMSPEDQRNTLITELVGRTKDGVKYYQSLNDSDLAGAGALLVYLRGTGSRTDPQIKTMSADDMRNTVIVEVGAKSGRGRELQALSNMDLVKMVSNCQPKGRRSGPFAWRRRKASQILSSRPLWGSLPPLRSRSGGPRTTSSGQSGLLPAEMDLFKSAIGSGSTYPKKRSLLTIT